MAWNGDVKKILMWVITKYEFSIDYKWKLYSEFRILKLKTPSILPMQLKGMVFDLG